MELNQLRSDSAKSQKRGIHFIIASVMIWIIVFIIHSTTLEIETKNLLTFCATAPLVPMAFFISKMLDIDFVNKGNPLSKLGLLFSFNQILYLLIAMWVMNQMPDKMVMVLAMIFGAHLLPYSWLYQSISYKVLAIVIPLISLLIGLLYEPKIVALIMIFIEIIFVATLAYELKHSNNQ